MTICRSYVGEGRGWKGGKGEGRGGKGRETKRRKERFQYWELQHPHLRFSLYGTANHPLGIGD
jgi:hypothetical protein